MRIPNLPDWNRRRGIERAADVVECSQGIVVISNLTIDERLELSHHPVHFAIDLRDEGAIGILWPVVLGQAARCQIAVPVLQLLFILPLLLLPLEQIFFAVALGGLEAVDKRLEVDDVVAHGHLR